MEPVRLEDLLGRERYGAQRDDIRRRLAVYKRARRIAVGPHCTFVFEDRATVWYQIQEMLWVESTIDLDAIRAELAVYNTMLPAPEELSATLLLEIERPDQVETVLRRLIGIDECVYLAIDGGPTARATFEPDRQTTDKLSAVQYVRFPIGPTAREAIVRGAGMQLTISHPHYVADVRLPEPLRQSLAAELEGPLAVNAALAQLQGGA